MGTIYDPPSAIAIMAAALEAAPEIRKRWNENAQRSDLIRRATELAGSDDIAGCNAILSGLVEKTYDPNQARDSRGRWAAGAAAVAEHASRVARVSRGVAGELSGQPAKLSTAVSNVASRIAGTARELESVLTSIRHLRGGSPDTDRHIVSLAAALRGLHRE